MNIPVNTITCYSADKGYRPLYFEINGLTYTLGNIVNTRIEKFAGTLAKVFCCLLESNGTTYEILLKYHVHDHQWLLVGGYENAFLQSPTRTTY
ncbi:MAG: hypothetical protein K0R00_919 [Herbinix sp.]|jgi:hypothetical protein|nr:hypothetical protein [Herbinix sp.]